MDIKKRRNFDRISNLPDSLLGQILSYLSTKESIATSVLSKRWRNLWLQAHVFDLDSRKCRDDDLYLSFLDRFLNPDNKHHLERFSLIYEVNHHDNSRFKSWINAVIMRNIRHLDIRNDLTVSDDVFIQMPITIYSCDRLVNLKLLDVRLGHPESVLLPCLKIMNLDYVIGDADSTLETLISSCPVLEELFIKRHPEDSIKVFCIRSPSLKNFKIDSYWCGDSDNVVEIDAPRIQYMTLSDKESENFIIHSIGPFATVTIDVPFNVGYAEQLDLDNFSRITIISNFFTRLSSLRLQHLIICYDTLKVIRDYCKVETLPQFDNLTSLHAYFQETLWEMLPSFLESFPNLKSLVLDLSDFPEREATEEINLSYVPQCLLSSLEFVHIKSRTRYAQYKGTPPSGRSSLMKLANYFLEKCVGLKKLSFSCL